MRLILKTTTLLLLLVTFISTPLFAVDYYWVGGSGNWNDITHWATTSGGSTKHAVVPSQNDDVYFDANSGFLAGTAPNKEVILSAGTNTCRNMLWDNAPEAPFLTGGVNSLLHIYGSLELQVGMTYRVAYTHFKSNTPGQTIRTNGVSIGVTYSSYIGNIIFDGDGDWTLLDDLTTGLYAATSRINLIKGGFNPLYSYASLIR